MVEFDRVNQASVHVHASVEITQFGDADGAAVDRLIAHLESDVFTGQLVLHVVEDVGDGFHHLRHDALTEVLTRGHQLDAQLIEQSLGKGRVDVVTEGARASVDDDVLDLGMLPQVFNHLQEVRSLVDGLGRNAGVEELLDDPARQVCGFAVDVDALGGNRVAVGVDIPSSIHLLLARHPQIRHS
nr:hypothetical protein [Nocardia brasiliensis]